MFPDGTSALVTRGTLDLAFRDGVHGTPSPLEPGREYDVELDLDACAYSFAAGQRLRVSVAGADWPNTVAPPAPVTLTVHGGELVLPHWDGTGLDVPDLRPGQERSSEDPEGVVWSVERDVLRRTTTARVASSTRYPTPYDGTASESYAGSVSVDRRTFAQSASAECTFELTWPGVEVRVHSTMEVAVDADGYDVTIDLVAEEAGTTVGRRSWRERLPR